MITIDLTQEEAQRLTGMVESFLSELRMEIADTDRMAYRDELKKRKALLIRILTALGETHPVQ